MLTHSLTSTHRTGFCSSSESASSRTRLVKPAWSTSCVALARHGSSHLRIRSVRAQTPRKQRCWALPQSANSMASTVLNKPYRFILVSDLDWTMVIQVCSATHYEPAGAARCITVAKCRLTITTNKTRLFTLSTSCGRHSSPRIACWCFQLAAH